MAPPRCTPGWWTAQDSGHGRPLPGSGPGRAAQGLAGGGVVTRSLRLLLPGTQSTAESRHRLWLEMAMVTPCRGRVARRVGSAEGFAVFSKGFCTRQAGGVMNLTSVCWRMEGSEEVREGAG